MSRFRFVYTGAKVTHFIYNIQDLIGFFYKILRRGNECCITG